MAQALIQIRSVSKDYHTADGRLTALDDISFDVREREFVAVVGQSGCGKSTLLKILAGVIPPSQGAITLRGHPITGPSDGLALVFQQPVLLPWRTVLDNVLLPMDVRGRRGSAEVARARELLALVGLAGFERRYPRELSGGMQQRVSIARAIIGDPEILLMDEPFGALDAMTREQMGWELMRIHAQSGKTILFVTHSITEAALLSDRVVIMSARPGRVDTIVDVELPRPRSPEMVVGERFGAYYTAIRERVGGKVAV